jgi:hypothetical protein
MLYSTVIIDGPIGKIIKFEGRSYLVPQRIPVNTKSELDRFTKYLDENMYKYRVLTTTTTSPYKISNRPGINGAKPAPPRVNIPVGATITEPVFPNQQELSESTTMLTEQTPVIPQSKPTSSSEDHVGKKSKRDE